MIEWTKFAAVLFDLDGVLTDTASLHARAWKETFDSFLSERFPDQPPFTIEGDYRVHVDGRPRYEGVATFLASRGIELPWSDPDDPPERDTVCGLGNRKNQLVGRLLDTGGVASYPGSKRLLEHLSTTPIKMAVVSSSVNAERVLLSAGLRQFFSVVVDGDMVARLGLRGKPHPDPFLKAAELLGVEPALAVVVEDAASGIAAGRAGGFGLVLGVSRHNDHEALLAAGADLVVEDLEPPTGVPGSSARTPVMAQRESPDDRRTREGANGDHHDDDQEPRRGPPE